MNTPFRKVVSFVFAALTFSSTLLAQAEPQMSEEERAEKAESLMKLARERIGGESKLDSIKSVRMKGVLVYGSGDSGTVDSVFKAPNYHQFSSVINAVRETTTLNRTEAWRKVERLSQPGVYTLDFYALDDLRHLEATVIDTLGFLDVPATRRGRVVYLGSEEVDGETYEVLVYAHSDKIWFRRYLDPETGRVVHMVNDKGVIFSYEGDMEVEGVLFPKKTIVRQRTQFGEMKLEVSYTDIALNVEIDNERFRMPVAAE